MPKTAKGADSEIQMISARLNDETWANNITEEDKALASKYTEQSIADNGGESQMAYAVRLLQHESTVKDGSDQFKKVHQLLSIIHAMHDTVIDDEVYDYVTINLTNAYDMLNEACTAYLKKSRVRFTKSGRYRAELVRDIQHLSKQEHAAFKVGIQKYESFGSGTTLRQIMAGMAPMQDAPNLQNMTDFHQEEGPENQAVSIPQLRKNLQGQYLGEKGTVIDMLLTSYGEYLKFPDKQAPLEVGQRIIALCGEEGLVENPVIGNISAYLTQDIQDKGLAKGDLRLGNDFHNITEVESSLGGADFDTKYGKNFEFSEYGHLSDQEVVQLWRTSKLHTDTPDRERKLYSSMIDAPGTVRTDEEKDAEKALTNEAFEHGYIKTAASSDINKYARDVAARKNNGDRTETTKMDEQSKTLRTMSILDDATREQAIPRKARLHRMVNFPFLQGAMGIDVSKTAAVNPNSSNGSTVSLNTNLVSAINQQAGRVLTDTGYMSVGYLMDVQFGNSPVMLTLLADEGTPAMFTQNTAESELVLPRGTSYMLLGAKLHAGSGGAFNMPGSHMDPSQVENAEQVGAYQYKGLEIIAKIIKQDTVKRSQAPSASQMNWFGAHAGNYEGMFGDHGDGVHRDAYLHLSSQEQARMSPDEAKAMDEYTHDSGDINTQLRSGEEKDAANTARIGHMKSAFSRHQMAANTKTYRGVDDGFLKYLMGANSALFPSRERLELPDGRLDVDFMRMSGYMDAFKGIVFQDKAFVSTSTNPYFAKRWANKVSNESLASHYESSGAKKTGQKYRQNAALNINTGGSHVLEMNLPKGTRAMFTDAMYTRENRPRGQNELTLDAGYTYRIDNISDAGDGSFKLEVSVVA